MLKQPRVVRCNLPPYQKNRARWRRDVLLAARSAADKAGAVYDGDPRLEVRLLLYLPAQKRLLTHDVDNRLKDVLDALQGHIKTSKAIRAPRLLSNDNCVYRVVVEKRAIPKGQRTRRPAPGGRLTIRRYRQSDWKA